MGGGLVLSGIGSDASGGLLDAFVGTDGSGSSDDAKKPLRTRSSAAEKTAARPTRRTRPRWPRWSARTSAWPGSSRTGRRPGRRSATQGSEEMRKADAAWGRYIATNPQRIDPGLAATAIAIYDAARPLPQDQKDKNGASCAPRATIAEQENTVDAYIKLVEVATQAGDTRTAGLAERKALSFAASKDDEATIKEQIETDKSSASRSPRSGWERSGAASRRPVTRLHARNATIPPHQPRSQVNFQINDESIDGDTHVIELGGEVDLYTAPEFKERLVQVIEDGKKHLVVDLSKATFIDSTTLGVLVGGVKRLRPSGGSLALVCTDQNISKIFEITGLDRVFPIHKSRDEALQSLGGASVPPGGTS